MLAPSTLILNLLLESFSVWKRVRSCSSHYEITLFFIFYYLFFIACFRHQHPSTLKTILCFNDCFLDALESTKSTVALQATVECSQPDASKQVFYKMFFFTQLEVFKLFVAVCVRISCKHLYHCFHRHHPRGHISLSQIACTVSVSF